jgi:hypothetical protein
MSGTGALRQFVPKAVRLGPRAAFGHPPLALGQTTSVAHDIGTNMRASWAMPASLATHSTRHRPRGCKNAKIKR